MFCIFREDSPTNECVSFQLFAQKICLKRRYTNRLLQSPIINQRYQLLHPRWLSKYNQDLAQQKFCPNLWCVWYKEIVPLLPIISWWHHRYNCNLRISPILQDNCEASDWLDKRLICRKWRLCCPTDLIGIWSNPPQIARGRVTLNIWAFDIPFVTNRSCSDPMKDARTYFFLTLILFPFKFSNMWELNIPFVPKSDCPRPAKDAGAGNYFRSFDFGFRLFSVFPHKGMLFCTLCGVAGM